MHETNYELKLTSHKVPHYITHELDMRQWLYPKFRYYCVVNDPKLYVRVSHWQRLAS
jgi:hypothetical protein